MTSEQFERLISAVERLADAVETLNGNAKTSNKPKFHRSISEFANFNWAAIGVEVLKRDQYGAAIVSYRGDVYYRRSHDKYGADIWFARGNGKKEDGTPNYEWLIKFSPLENKEVEPISRKAEAVLHALMR